MLSPPMVPAQAGSNASSERNMLNSLSIRDFVLIESLELTPRTGLTVLTGETGAGKSILLDALGAACGVRSEAGLVRQTAEKATVSANFTLPTKHPVLALLNENEIASEDNTLILRRVISADGRSKAFINDQSVSIGLLREIGARLVEVHGQFDTHGLLDPATHRPALDKFGGLDTGKVSAAWTHWQNAKQAEDKARATLAAAKAEEDLLRDAVDELTKLAPQTGEEESLIEQKKLLQGREKLAAALTGALDALAGEQGAEIALTNASRALVKTGENERITRALAQIDTARDAVAEAQNALESLQDDVEGNGLSLDQVEDRLYALRGAARRHGVTAEQLPELCDTLSAKLSSLSRGEDDLRGLAEATLTAKAAYDSKAAMLSAQRASTAKKLEKAIQAELAPLKMERATFTVSLTTCAPSETGVDAAQFQASTNPGTPSGAINRIASGGELARFMLALKVALAGVGEAVTLVFDEVDQGVGGAVAAAVGDRLAKLGSDVQVLVVTHSPQVAAKAAHHWKVSKAVSNKSTRTSVDTLNDTARREEIARMLAGETVTEASRKAAGELLQAPA